MLNLIYLTNKLNIAFHLKKSEITIYKFNSLCLNVLRILQELNIIESFLVNSSFESCKIFFNNIKSSNIEKKIINITKPNRYIYYSINDLINLRAIDLYNDYIISVNDQYHTIINIDKAIYLHKGGLLLLKIIKN